MSTQPPAQPQPERMTAQELRANFDALQKYQYHLNEEIEQLHFKISGLTESLNAVLEFFQKAATLPQPSPTPATATNAAGLEIVAIHTVTLTYDPKGTPVYHAMGGKYSKFGARIWPEVLPALGIDPLTLKPGPNAWANTVQIQPAHGERAPKVIGLA